MNTITLWCVTGANAGMALFNCRTAYYFGRAAYFLQAAATSLLPLRAPAEPPAEPVAHLEDW